MLTLVTIDLSSADLASFEAYERDVIPLLKKYEARMLTGVRSVDALTEWHLLFFPDSIAFERFISDPERTSMQQRWIDSGVQSSIVEVDNIDYL